MPREPPFRLAAWRPVACSLRMRSCGSLHCTALSSSRMAELFRSGKRSINQPCFEPFGVTCTEISCICTQENNCTSCVVSTSDVDAPSHHSTLPLAALRVIDVVSFLTLQLHACGKADPPCRGVCINARLCSSSFLSFFACSVLVLSPVRPLLLHTPAAPPSDT